VPEEIFLEGVVKRFPKSTSPALDAKHVRLQGRRRIGIVGPDGAGKTTLLRLLAGLLIPTEGSIRLFGIDVGQDPSAVHNLIGYMPQKFGLYEDLTVLENLRLYADLQGVTRENRTQRFAELLSFSDLTAFQERLAGDLSGGMKQKLGLSCALVKRPKVLLLDEPTVGVDPLSRKELWQMVSELLQDGVTVLWSTSYLDEAELCDETLLLHEGKILFQGSPSVLTERMKGRVFLVHNLRDKRSSLSHLVQDQRVLDVSIQSDALRLAMCLGEKPSFLQEGEVQETTPRFEDAFIDILGKKELSKDQFIYEKKNISISDNVVIEAKALQKYFGSFCAVKEMGFQVRAGEVFGLLGPNGAGKSTTFKMLCGLLRPSSGGAFVCGVSLETAPSIARGRVGYMAQKFSLYGNMSVRQNLQFFSGIYPIAEKQKNAAMQAVITSFGLSEVLEQETSLLSLGYKQRLALACALMHQPDVLFLDEPTAGVDPLTRREFWGQINQFVRRGMTVMVTTHFLDEAESVIV